MIKPTARNARQWIGLGAFCVDKVTLTSFPVRYCNEKLRAVLEDAIYGEFSSTVSCSAFKEVHADDWPSLEADKSGIQTLSVENR